MSRSLVIFRHNSRLLLGDPGPIAVFLATPLLVMAILKPTFGFILADEGFKDANGAEHAVPGFTVMFAFFWISFVGRNFIAEHGWGTWERLRGTSASPMEIMLGKLMPAFVVILAQVTILFLLGALLFDVDSKGPVLAVAVVAVPLTLCVLSLTLALVGLAGTLSQIDAVGNLFTMLFAAVGGALAPVSVLPGWAQDIAPATPTYWAVKASHDVILEGDGLSAVLAPAGVLMLFTAGFFVVALLTFRFGAVKVAT